MSENYWYKLKDQVNNPLGYVETERYDIKYRCSIIDNDNIDDTTKIKLLYNELMTLKNELSAVDRTLSGEINYLHAENKKLSDEIAAIKQALYFG